MDEVYTFGPLARYGGQVQEKKGHKLGMKRICKIKKHPPTTSLSVDKGIEIPLKWRSVPIK